MAEFGKKNISPSSATENSYADDDAREGSLFKWVSILIVLIAVSGFLGLAWYAYKSGNDSANEKDVDLILADKSPIKESPSNPGGLDIPNQDKTVYGLIRGEKEEKNTVEHVLPAPEEPITRNDTTETWMSDSAKRKLNGDDITKKSETLETPAQKPAATTTEIIAPKDKLVDANASAPNKEQFNPAKARGKTVVKPDISTVATAQDTSKNVPETTSSQDKPAVAATTAPVQPVKEPPTTTVANVPVATVTSATASTEASSPPQTAKTPPTAASDKLIKETTAHPADHNTTHAPEKTRPSEALPTTKSDEKKPESDLLKSIRIQLGAYKSEAEAKQDWTKISRKFSSLLSSKEHVIVHITIPGKGNFYRLQVGGFASGKEAEKFCLGLVSEGQGCFLAKK